jgi:hypothetical protein
MAVNIPGFRPAPYARRRPEATAIYRIVQQHLETHLALPHEDDWDGQAMPGGTKRSRSHSRKVPTGVRNSRAKGWLRLTQRGACVS